MFMMVDVFSMFEIDIEIDTNVKIHKKILLMISHNLKISNSHIESCWHCIFWRFYLYLYLTGLVLNKCLYNKKAIWGPTSFTFWLNFGGGFVRDILLCDKGLRILPAANLKGNMR